MSTMTWVFEFEVNYLQIVILQGRLNNQITKTILKKRNVIDKIPYKTYVHWTVQYA